MIAVNIGKKFLEKYNELNKSNLSAEAFFNEVYFPLFYDHEKYMQWITNSPFVQGLRKELPLQKEERKEKLEALHEKILNEDLDASIAIGFPSLDANATTSGQISNLSMDYIKEDAYFSWIGSGFGVGVNGGLSIYFNEPNILMDIFAGWKEYRKFLRELDTLRPNQIDTWNGRWLAALYSQDDDLNPDLSDAIRKKADANILELERIAWSELMLGVALRGKNETLLYVFSLGQTNKTIGFIPINLPSMTMPLQFYSEIFGENDYLDDVKKIKTIFGNAYGFERICQNGRIGIEALLPRDLEQQYMRANKQNIPSFNNDSEEKKIAIRVYQMWLLAMLGEKHFWGEADSIGKELALLYKNNQIGKDISTGKQQEINDLLFSPQKADFVRNATKLLKYPQMNTEALYKVVKIINEITNANYRLFITLIRFRFGFYNSKEEKV